jgi:hypothetical protein
MSRQSEIWIPDVVTNATQWGKRAIGARTQAMASEAYRTVWRF